jgi:hypothetical protein
MLKVMKKKQRSRVFKDIINRIYFVKGFDKNGNPKEKWIVMEKTMKLNNTIETQEKKLNNTINITKKARLGDLVTHSEHPLGIGLVVEKHTKQKAYRVSWVEQPLLNLFIDEAYLIPINKEHAHESDDL